VIAKTRRSGICPDCDELPKEATSGIPLCACGRRWYRTRAVKGTEQETAELKRYGFELTEDRRGDSYYCGPMGHIIEFYADGAWNSDKADPNASLYDYLEWIKGVLASSCWAPLSN
jgi:hypothetical protein